MQFFVQIQTQQPHFYVEVLPFYYCIVIVDKHEVLRVTLNLLCCFCCNKIVFNDLLFMNISFLLRLATVATLVQPVSSVMYWQVNASAKLNLEDKTVPGVHWASGTTRTVLPVTVIWVEPKQRCVMTLKDFVVVKKKLASVPARYWSIQTLLGQHWGFLDIYYIKSWRV